jgi:hypothetical protein
MATACVVDPCSCSDTRLTSPRLPGPPAGPHSPCYRPSPQKPRLVDPEGRIYARLCNFTGQPNLAY